MQKDRLCLTTSANSNLSLGPLDVGHKGVATRCCEFSLTGPRAKTGFRIGPPSAGVELEWHFMLFLQQTVDRMRIGFFYF